MLLFSNSDLQQGGECTPNSALIIQSKLATRVNSLHILKIYIQYEMEIPQDQSRHLQVKQTREVLKMNDRIKALIETRKRQQHHKISQYIKQKIDDSKVKRTVSMRNKFLDYSKKTSEDQTDLNSLSIDTSNVNNNLNTVNKNKIKKRHNTNAEYVERLIEFYDFFQKGQMDQKYQTLLADFTQKHQDQITSENRAEFIKKASQAIKKKLFKDYLKSTLKKQVMAIPITQKINLSLLDDKKPFLSNRASIQKIQAQEKPKGGKTLRVHYCEPDTPYVFKQRSKFSQRRFESIRKQCQTQIEGLNHAIKIQTKTRKINQFLFLSKIKERKNNSLKNYLFFQCPQ